MNDVLATSYVKKLFALVLGLGAIYLAVLAWNDLRYPPRSHDVATNTISVMGEGEAFAKPDIAHFTFSVTETAVTVADAQKKATDRMNKAIKYLKDAGVADKDIKTTAYNIYPKYEYQGAPCLPEFCPSRNPKIVGYETSQSVEVKVRALEKAGDLLTGVGQLGVQNISGLTFSVDLEDSVKTSARNEAIANAKKKAEELASKLGVRLVRIVTFYESGNSPYYYATKDSTMGMGGASIQAAPAVPVPSGENKYTSQVTVTYEIR
jgi:uncharacterized protein YggE